MICICIDHVVFKYRESLPNQDPIVLLIMLIETNTFLTWCWTNDYGNNYCDITI